MWKPIRRMTYVLRAPWMDIGRAEDTIIVAGMGRSGTTWAANVINYDRGYRVLFEPFRPAVVKEARAFEYITYLGPDHEDKVLAGQARKILAGQVRGHWVDQENAGLLYRRRIVKDIRCNLMLGWLRRIGAQPPIVLMVRHPLQVVASWRKLGWGREPASQRSDLDIITSQPALLRDFPVVAEALRTIDPEDVVESLVCQWCIFHLVPAKQLQAGEAYLLYYEQMLSQPEDEVVRLFRYLQRPLDWDRARQALGRPSSTDAQHRDFARDAEKLITGWRSEFTAPEIRRAREIMALFGLDDLYDDDGFPIGRPLLRNQPGTSTDHR